ncbi:MarR family winged helix-turn-helix transcriptional regulator [uncultured Jatrophihabitans sp.]|uniref:MarR family winged helix-turn-helix transcriptional regulator n=1 Tax=uncultured Jatrophihabitans sp. TaxID=1610747 RepID=UPI0035CB2137
MTAENEETLAEAFWAVARQLRRGSRDALAPWGISPSHGRALMVIARLGPIRLSALSDHLRIAARSTTEVADALEERGLVRRLPDPTDRRATLVELTDAGRELVHAMHASRSAEAEAVFGALGEKDRAALARILAALRAAPATRPGEG